MSMPHREVCPIRHCQGHASAFSYGVKSKKDGHVSNSGKDGQFTAMEGFEVKELASVVYPALCIAVKTTVRSSLSSTPSTMSFASSSCASVVAVLNCLYLERRVSFGAQLVEGPTLCSQLPLLLRPEHHC